MERAAAAGEVEEAMRRAIEVVSSLPPGPVHLDVAAEVTSAAARWRRCKRSEPTLVAQPRQPPAPNPLVSIAAPRDLARPGRAHSRRSLRRFAGCRNGAASPRW